MKLCRKCGTVKPLEAFHNDRSKPDGKHTTCKACKRRYDVDKYWADPEGEKAKALAYYYAHREAQIAKAKARVDPAAKRQYDREYGQRPDVRTRRAKQRRAWNLAHPEHAIPHNKARSQARRGARPNATAKGYMAVLISDPCSYCSESSEQIDHIVPLKHRGDSGWSNLTAACQSCNYAKRDKSLLTFLLSVPSGGSY